MIRATGLTLRRGTKVLLQNADFVVHPSERVGIVGKNGAGKSTLFALLLHEIDQDAGQLDIPSTWRVASVRQEIHGQQAIAREFVIDGDQHLRHLQALRANTPDSQGDRIAELELALEEAGVYTASSRAEQLLAGLGFTPEQWEKPVKEFSGGWQMRLLLARALMMPSDLLLLDEPTNHLDLDAMVWLEKWIAQYPGTVLLISHDSEFLNNVARTILHFEHQTLQRYKGNYDSYLTQQAERFRQNQLAYEKQQREMAHTQAFIDRFKAKATKAKQAQSRIKALNRMTLISPLQSEHAIHIRLPQPEQMPDPLIVIEHAKMGYGDRVILDDANLIIRGGARIGILGMNGAGKSTFIKSLVGELPLLSGRIQRSSGLKVAYFAQHQLDMLDVQASPLLHLQRLSPTTREQELRNYLGSFGFIGDQALSPIAPFSGGEKARLALALLVWQKPNLLLLDEPSNHLDMDTRETLAQALAEFEGSMLLVSHDRHLLRTTTDEFYIVADGQITAFDGDLEDYQQWLAQRNQQAKQAVKNQSDPSTNEPDRKTQKRLEAQERQRKSILKKPLLADLNKVETQLEALNSTLENINDQISRPDFYEDHYREQRMQLLNQHGQLSTQKEQLEERWLELQTQLEALENE